MMQGHHWEKDTSVEEELGEKGKCKVVPFIVSLMAQRLRDLNWD